MAIRRKIIGPGEYGAVIRGKPVEAWRMVEAPLPLGSVRVGPPDLREYVTESEFKKLTRAEQAYLKKRGVTAFNLEQERIHGRQVKAYEEAVAFVEREKAAQEKWEKENIVEVGPKKEHILRTTYEKMTPEHRGLLKRVGIKQFNVEMAKPVAVSGRELFDKLIKEGTLRPDAVYIGYDLKTGKLKYEEPLPVLTGRQLFQQMQSDGKIPKDAVYKGYDKGTGEVKYEVPAPVDPKVAATMERLEEFITGGKLNIRAAVMAGFTKVADYLGWDVKKSDIAKALEYKKWTAQYTTQELKEIESGKYLVYDYETDKFVAVTKKAVQEREQFYRDFPGVGPPGTPGKVTPAEYETERIAALAAGVTVLRETTGVGTELSKYAVGDGHDIARYLRDNPGDTQTLRDAGFEEPDIVRAEAYNTQPFVQESPIETWWEKIEAAGGTGLNMYEFQNFLLEHPELAEEGGGAVLAPAPIVTTTPEISLEQFTAEFMAARGIEPMGIVGIAPTLEQRKAKELAVIQYGKTYGEAALAGSGATAAATLLFAPARAAYPEVELSDITPLEWGIGVAQVALLASPLITAPIGALGALTAARVTGIALRGASGLMFTAATAISWNSMSEAEKVLAVGIDTIILASAVIPGVGMIVGKRFKVLTGKVIDTSAKITKTPKIKGALDDISTAIQKQDIKLLRAGAKRLEIEAAKVPKQLGGDYLRKRAALMAAKPEDYVGLSKTPLDPKGIKPVENSIKANKNFIETAERALRRDPKPTTKVAIEEALKTARKQVAVAEKVKLRPLIQMPKEFPKGKYLPTVIKKAGLPAKIPVKRPPGVVAPEVAPKVSVFPGIKVKTTTAAGVTREAAIPSEVFGRMTLAQIAKHYGVTEEELIWAVATSPIATEIMREQTKVTPGIIPVTPAITPFAEAIARGRPLVAPFPTVSPKVRAVPLPVPERAIKTVPAVVTIAEVAPAPESAPKPIPYHPVPTPKPTPVPTPKPTPKPTPPPKLKLPKEEAGRKKYPDGTIVWRQGAWWKIIPPPYTVPKPLSSRKPPVGVTVLKGTPQQTLTFLGGKMPFTNVSFDLGVVDGFIDVKTKRIVFTGYGELTDVGKRLPSPTRGLSLEKAKALGIKLPRLTRTKVTTVRRPRVETQAAVVTLRGKTL